MVSVLAVEPETRRFSLSGEAALREVLEQLDRSSDLLPINSPLDVTLLANGTLGNGLRITTWALYQICRAVCPGLYKVLVGLQADPRAEARLASLGLLNQLVRLQFRDKLSGQLLLCDRRLQQVEAMVSPRYKFRPNLSIYQQTQLAVDSLGQETLFQEAILHGRWLLLRYFCRPCLFEDGSDRFYGGFHFSNHEGGLASVRGANSLIRERGRLTMLTPFTRDRHVRHTGRKFDAQVRDLLRHVVDFQTEATALRSGIHRLQAQQLGLGLATEKAENKRRAQLVAQLVRHNVPDSLGSRVVAATIVQPHDVDKPIPLVVLRNEVIATRTAYDLAVTCCREAKSCSISVRETLEQAAYGLVSGRFKLK